MIIFLIIALAPIHSYGTNIEKNFNELISNKYLPEAADVFSRTTIATNYLNVLSLNKRDIGNSNFSKFQTKQRIFNTPIQERQPPNNITTKENSQLLTLQNLTPEDNINVSPTPTTPSTILMAQFASSSKSLFLSHPFWAVLMCIFVVALIIFTVIGNCMVCFAVLIVRKLKQQPANLLLVSLAVADFSVGLFVMPIALVNIVEDRWIFGQFVCQFWTSADLMLCTASILNLCVISVDRYLTVTRALRYIALRTRKRMFAYICVVWMGALFVSATPLIFLPLRPTVEHSCQVSQNRLYQIYATIISFYAPCFIMVIVYLRMWRAAKKIQKRDYTSHKCNISTPLKHHNQPSGESTCSSDINSCTKTTKAQTSNFCGKENNNFMSFFCCCCSRHKVKKEVNNNQCISLFINNLNNANNKKCKNNKNVECFNTNVSFGNAQLDGNLNNKKSDAVSDNKIQQLPLLTKPESQQTHHQNRSRLMFSLPFLTTAVLTHNSTTTVSASSTTAAVAAVIHSPLKRFQRSSTLFNAFTSRHHDKGEDKARKTLGVIMSVFICCWVPFFILALLKSQNVVNVPKWLDVLVLWLGYSNSMLNPLIYCKYNRDFRIPFREMICFRFSTIQVVMRNKSFYTKFGPPKIVAELRNIKKQNDASTKENSCEEFGCSVDTMLVGEKQNSSVCAID